MQRGVCDFDRSCGISVRGGRCFFYLPFLLGALKETRPQVSRAV